MTAKPVNSCGNGDGIKRVKTFRYLGLIWNWLEHIIGIGVYKKFCDQSSIFASVFNR